MRSFFWAVMDFLLLEANLWFFFFFPNFPKKTDHFSRIFIVKGRAKVFGLNFLAFLTAKLFGGVPSGIFCKQPSPFSTKPPKRAFYWGKTQPVPLAPVDRYEGNDLEAIYNAMRPICAAEQLPQSKACAAGTVPPLPPTWANQACQVNTIGVIYVSSASAPWWLVVSGANPLPDNTLPENSF